MKHCCYYSQPFSKCDCPWLVKWILGYQEFTSDKDRENIDDNIKEYLQGTDLDSELSHVNFRLLFFMILIVTQIIFFGLIEEKRTWLLVLDKMCLNNHIFNNFYCNKRQMLKFVLLQIFKIYLHMIVQYIIMNFSE